MLRHWFKKKKVRSSQILGNWLPKGLKRKKKEREKRRGGTSGKDTRVHSAWVSVTKLRIWSSSFSSSLQSQFQQQVGKSPPRPSEVTTYYCVTGTTIQTLPKRQRVSEASQGFCSSRHGNSGACSCWEGARPIGAQATPWAVSGPTTTRRHRGLLLPPETMSGGLVKTLSSFNEHPSEFTVQEKGTKLFRG